MLKNIELCAVESRIIRWSAVIRSLSLSLSCHPSFVMLQFPVREILPYDAKSIRERMQVRICEVVFERLDAKHKEVVLRLEKDIQHSIDAVVEIAIMLRKPDTMVDHKIPANMLDGLDTSLVEFALGHLFPGCNISIHTTFVRVRWSI